MIFILFYIFFKLITWAQWQSMTLLSLFLIMSPNNDVEMVINPIEDLFMKNCDNYDKVRGRTLVSSMHCPCSQVIAKRTML